MLGNIGPMEVIIVLIVALLIFGPKRLPELGKSMGDGLREFKSSLSKANPAPELADIAKSEVAPLIPIDSKAAASAQPKIEEAAAGE